MPPSLYPTVLFDKLDEFLLEFEQHDKEIKAGMASVGDAAAYALVWEWGNIRQSLPGPKTVLGTNPNGKTVWLSGQAPFGYIRVNTPQYWKAVHEAMRDVNFNQPNAKAMTRELEREASKASKMFVDITQLTVPVDSGDLRDSLKPVAPNDPILDEEPESNYVTLVLEDE